MPHPDLTLHAERRRRFMERMGGGAALIPAAPPRLRSRDTDHRYRPDSDFFYLTGFNEPHALLLLLPGHAEHRSVVFVQPKDPVRETWDGRRLGVEAAPAHLGVDAAYAVDEIEAVLPRYLSGLETLHYALGAHPEHDAWLLKLLPRLGNRHAEPPSQLLHPGRILHEMRLRKDAHEQERMRRAASITAAAYGEAVRAIRPGGHEYEVQAALEGAYRRLGGDGPAYGSIVASGENATILHYTENDQPLEAGDLLLIDSGAEFGWYACDVSRTYPVSGRFTPAQRAIYDLVLKAQEAAIDEVRLGNHVKTYHETAVRVLTAGLVELGLLTGGVDALIAEERYRTFYMHGTGHYLGLDTHDVGRYRVGADWRPLEPGMVLTVEPGLYVAPGTPGVDPAFYGIGVRIEDDVLVTAGAPEVLTLAIPKAASEVEALVGGALVL